MKNNSLTTHKINILASLINTAAEAILREKFNITYNEYLVLLNIREHVETSQVVLTNCTNLTKSAISKILKLLGERKIVFIQQSKTSKRTNVVSLTQMGSKIVAEATELLEKSFMSYYESFESKTKIQNFDEQLTKIIEKFIKHH